jgi:hypothetical protein
MNMKYNIKFLVEPYKNSYVKLSHRWHKRAWKRFTLILKELGYEERDGGLTFVRNKKILDDFYVKGLISTDYLEGGDHNQIIYITEDLQLNVGAVRRFSGYQYLQNISLDIINVYLIAVKRYLNMLAYKDIEIDQDDYDE